MSLKTQVYQLIDDSIDLCRGCPEAGDLAKILSSMRERLESPLRVAVAGIMKAGKSTFMNALMGENLVYTGILETTYTVCWFKYAPNPAIKICFRDGSSVDAKYEELEKWSVRKSGNKKIDDVKYLIIYYPSEVLKTLEFIDTPGLNSIYGTDAQNTLDFLEIKGSEDTLNEASQADAIVYAFSRSAGGYDEELLRAFQSGGTQISSPINSVGILTKTDSTGIWNIDEDRTPVETADQVVKKIMENASMKHLVYAAFPVCAKAVEGLGLLSEDDWGCLSKISKISKEERIDLLFDSELFAIDTDEYYSQYGKKEIRTSLINKVGQYGIMEISDLLAQNISREEIKNILSEKCGITTVRDVLLSHFGNRTFLIKTQFIFNTLQATCRNLKRVHRKNNDIRAITDEIEEKIEELTIGIQTLNELRILQYYYNGQLEFQSDDEFEDFMQVTGEYGREPEKRLGIEGLASVWDMKNVAEKKIAKWHEKASSFMMSNTYVDAATTIARSYEHIYYYLSALCDE